MQVNDKLADIVKRLQAIRNEMPEALSITVTRVVSPNHITMHLKSCKDMLSLTGKRGVEIETKSDGTHWARKQYPWGVVVCLPTSKELQDAGFTQKQVAVVSYELTPPIETEAEAEAAPEAEQKEEAPNE